MTIYIVTIDRADHGGSRVEILAVCRTHTRAYSEALRQAAMRWDIDDETKRGCDPLRGIIDIEAYEVLP